MHPLTPNRSRSASGILAVRIPRTEIRSVDNETKSLMYEGLLEGLTEEQVGSLLDYIVSLGGGV